MGRNMLETPLRDKIPKSQKKEKVKDNQFRRWHEMEMEGDMTRIATFRSEYEYEIDYEYDFLISNQSRSQSPRSLLLQTSREWGSRNKILDVLM